MALFKIDSSTNELPLSDIDFSQNPCSPESVTCDMTSPQREEAELSEETITMDSDANVENREMLPKISPMATNEHPLSSSRLTILSSADNTNVLRCNNDRSKSNVGSMQSLISDQYASAKLFEASECAPLSCSAPAAILTHDTDETAIEKTKKPCNMHAKDFLSIPPITKSESDTILEIPSVKPPPSPPSNTKRLTRHLSHDGYTLSTTNANPMLLHLLPEPPESFDSSSIADIDCPDYPIHNSSNSPSRTNHIPEPLSSPTALYNMPFKVFASNLLMNENNFHQSTTMPSSSASIQQNKNHKKLAKLLALTNDTFITPNQLVNKLNSHPMNTTLTTVNADNPTSTSSSSSVSSRRQRHGIAGQMTYVKMLGFGGFGKKMTTSTNSLFSTAVISGSSSAPNLRDMIPSTVTPSGFGGVPPVRPLETLHNALSLKQLDMFLERMTVAPLFKTPASSPPKNPSTPIPIINQTSINLPIESDKSLITPTNLCHPLGTELTGGNVSRMRCPLNENPTYSTSSKFEDEDNS